jgi:hypothetical protein
MFPGGDIMLPRLIAAGFAALIAVTPALAQTSQQGENKPETNCTPSSASSASGQTTGSAGSTGNSMAMEKSAILPSAGGHAHSSAPTVQSEGKPMQVRPECPPDQAKK